MIRDTMRDTQLFKVIYNDAGKAEYQRLSDGKLLTLSQERLEALRRRKQNNRKAHLLQMKASLEQRLLRIERQLQELDQELAEELEEEAHV